MDRQMHNTEIYQRQKQSSKRCFYIAVCVLITTFLLLWGGFIYYFFYRNKTADDYFVLDENFLDRSKALAIAGPIDENNTAYAMA